MYSLLTHQLIILMSMNMGLHRFLAEHGENFLILFLCLSILRVQMTPTSRTPKFVHLSVYAGVMGFPYSDT